MEQKVKASPRLAPLPPETTGRAAYAAAESPLKARQRKR
jgi:hypothetical protein